MSEDTATTPRLGRGLSALLGDEENDNPDLDKVRATKSVPLEFVEAGRFQPRVNFDDADMAALAQSVREKGILQPILVRRHPEAANKYEIVAGERRWRAAQAAQLHEIPVIIREFSDRDALEAALVENIQREGLGPLEEATAYQRLMSEFSHTQEDTAKAVGKSRSHVANTLRLLELDDEVKQLVDRGALTAGHARALLKSKEQVATAKAVVAKGLNVRQTEDLCRQTKPRPVSKVARTAAEQPAAYARDADTVALERDLSNLLGLKVSIQFQGTGGSITIHYKTLEQLDDVLQRLNETPPAGGKTRDPELQVPADSTHTGIDDNAAGTKVAAADEDILVLTEEPDSPAEPSADAGADDIEMLDDVSESQNDGGGVGKDIADAEPSKEALEEIKSDP